MKDIVFLDEQERNEKINLIQEEAVDAFINNKGVGTLNLAVGLGKTITAFKCLYRMVELGWIQKGAVVRFLAEVNTREFTLQEEFEQFKRLFGKEVNKDFQFRFHCYQGIPPGGADVDIYDEADDTMTAKYIANITENGAKYRIGLTATVPENTTVYRDKVADELINQVYQSDKATRKGIITDFINKGQAFEILCPVVYSKSLPDAISEGLLAPFDTYIVEHQLDTLHRNIKIWKSYDRVGSERDWYDSRVKLMGNYSTPRHLKKITGQQMTRFLYNLSSKAVLTKAIIKRLEISGEKIVVFGESLELLDKITPNVMRDDNDLIEKFNNGEINIIASVKKLRKGITLNGVTACILIGYSSTWNSLEQRIGRIVRYKEGKKAKLIIIRTNGTLEMKWFNNMQIVKDSKGNVIRKIDLGIRKNKGILDGRSLISWYTQYIIKEKRKIKEGS